MSSLGLWFKVRVCHTGQTPRNRGLAEGLLYLETLDGLFLGAPISPKHILVGSS